MKNHGQMAVDNFRRGYNCAQSVALVFADELGMREEDVARMASSFGGGMGKLREVCGAVSGALLVLGILQGYSSPDDSQGKAAHYARVQQFANRFKEKHETIVCRELLKNISLRNENTSAPEPRTDEYYRIRPCAYFVETAADVLAEMLAE